MIKSIYNFCLLYTNSSSKSFGIIGLQTDNTFILANDIFTAIKDKKLKKVKLLAKNRKKLTYNTLIKVNRSYIKLVVDNNLFLT